MGFVHELHKIAIAKFAVNQTFQNFSKLKLLENKRLQLPFAYILSKGF